jgi:hypothetical protein
MVAMIFGLWFSVCDVVLTSWGAVGCVEDLCPECLADLAVSNSVLVPMVNIQSQTWMTMKKECVVDVD